MGKFFVLSLAAGCIAGKSDPSATNNQWIGAIPTYPTASTLQRVEAEASDCRENVNPPHFADKI